MTILRAALVAPMAGPAIVDGAVAFDGDRVIAVGKANDVLAKHVDADVIDYGDAVILPGLVNAHAHFELSWQRRPETPGTFQDWILACRAQWPQQPDAVRGLVRRATERAAAESLSFGVTSVGDISQLAAETREVLGATPLLVRSYGECLGLGARRPYFDYLLAEALKPTRHANVRVGVSPHAPYTVDVAGYEAALAAGVPLCTHLSETYYDEARFLVDHRGPFGTLYERLGFHPGPADHVVTGPIGLGKNVGLFRAGVLLAHLNYCDDWALDQIAGTDAAVVYCPRTHAYFGHPPHRFTDMLDRGITVAIGTDSVASSPDLDLVAELRHVREVRPDVPAETLWRMATTSGAAALELDDEVGSLTPGKRADACVFDATNLDDALHAGRPRAVWAGGEVVSK